MIGWAGKSVIKAVPPLEPASVKPASVEPASVEPEAAAQLLWMALIEIRSLGGQGEAERAGALADAVHNLPLLLRSGGISRQRLISDLTDYQAQYPDNALFDYLNLLEVEPLEEIIRS